MKELLGALVPLALFVCKGVDFVRGVVDPNGKLVKWLWIGLAFGLGVTVAFVLRVQLAATLFSALGHSANGSATFHPVHLAPWADELFTGFAIGGAASFWHHGLDLLSSHAAKVRAVAAEKNGDVLR